MTLATAHTTDSRYAASRLAIAVFIMTLGAAGMYVVPVALPTVQADFGVARGQAALPFSLLMIGFGFGGLVMGRLADRHGVMVPLVIGGTCLGIGFVSAAFAPSLLAFNAIHGLLIGFAGSSATFSPLVADTSLWWVKRRGIAVAICASGNYIGGAVWPPIINAGIEAFGWRRTYMGLGAVCGVAIVALALFMRERPPQQGSAATRAAIHRDHERPFGLAIATALVLLMVAGLACCVAMSMPQVHIVAYCGDLGYGAARGAEMLSVMMAFGVVSRLASGWLSDHIGGMRTLLLGSALQGVALLLFLPFDGLVSLYVISALFGLFQGGIVPSYAIIVREHFPAARTGALVGAVIMCTLFGMALGGWLSGAIFDATGSYRAAFWNGIAWNALNLVIAGFLLHKLAALSRQPS
jgi:MFS family permease